MRQYVFTFLGLILLAPALTVAAESAYPPPPPAGQAITVEDSIYGVLRTNRAMRGIQVNRNVLERRSLRG